MWNWTNCHLKGICCRLSKGQPFPLLDKQHRAHASADISLLIKSVSLEVQTAPSTHDIQGLDPLQTILTVFVVVWGREAVLSCPKSRAAGALHLSAFLQFEGSHLESHQSHPNNLDDQGENSLILLFVTDLITKRWFLSGVLLHIFKPLRLIKLT